MSQFLSTPIYKIDKDLGKLDILGNRPNELIKNEPKAPLLKCPLTGEMSETKDILARIFKMQNSGEKLHPYEMMTVDAVKRFPNCVEEILTFFEHEKKINLALAEKPELPGTISSRTTTRSIQWAQFWAGISELNLERHNEKIRKKKEEKNERRGKGRKRIDVFNGPTYGYSR